MAQFLRTSYHNVRNRIFHLLRIKPSQKCPMNDFLRYCRNKNCNDPSKTLVFLANYLRDRSHPFKVNPITLLRTKSVQWMTSRDSHYKNKTKQKNCNNPSRNPIFLANFLGNRPQPSKINLVMLLKTRSVQWMTSWEKYTIKTKKCNNPFKNLTTMENYLGNKGLFLQGWW